ncbi:hypothetical protein J2Y69_003229 [Microbacterium resistens]|uniref:Uncharacterized protein n=1 Tax=Microbacterium resistens TaxID=156977 RepID=A0ABU1SG77_9MICO|nr:hypothetical protein [Microbacterium resistens]
MTFTLSSRLRHRRSRQLSTPLVRLLRQPLRPSEHSATGKTIINLFMLSGSILLHQYVMGWSHVAGVTVGVMITSYSIGVKQWSRFWRLQQTKNNSIAALSPAAPTLHIDPIFRDCAGCAPASSRETAILDRYEPRSRRHSQAGDGVVDRIDDGETDFHAERASQRTRPGWQRPRDHRSRPAPAAAPPRRRRRGDPDRARRIVPLNTDPSPPEHRGQGSPARLRPRAR